MKSISLLSTILLINIMPQVTCFKENECVLVKEVDNLDNLDITTYDFDKGIIFYKNIENNEYTNSNISDISNSTDLNVIGNIFGTYFYKIDNSNIGQGYLIGTNYTTKENMLDMVNSIKEDIDSNQLTKEYKTLNANNVVTMSIGTSWQTELSQKLTWSLDYEGIHYGDFSEWYTSFRIISNNYKYYLITHETYVSPNNDNTDDFRTSKIIYNFDPKSEQIELRDYEPKSKNPEMNISYGIDLGAEISSDNDAKVSASVSSTYSTTLESPKIYDKGNMAKNLVNIEFEYLHPDLEKEPWYSYNVNQSMQTAVYLIRENKSNTSSVKMYDVRTIQMLRDDFWPWNDKYVNFKYTYIYTL